MNADEFEKQYAANSGVPVSLLRAMGRYVLPCECNEGACAGWQMAHAEIQEPKFPLEHQWKIGERVEQVPTSLLKWRTGTVARIQRRAVWVETLIIDFDDGESRGINPDVLRHIR